MRVLIADDHPQFRHALREDLERGGVEVCAEAGTGAEAVTAALRERPDVCLLDVQMPGDGTAAAKAIRRELPGTKVILITATPDEEGVMAAARAGAVGYLAKDVNPHKLPEIVRAVAEGDTAYPRSLLGVLLRSLSEQLGSLSGRSRHDRVKFWGGGSVLPGERVVRQRDRRRGRGHRWRLRRRGRRRGVWSALAGWSL